MLYKERTPVASACGPRSSQTYTQPDEIARRSSVSSLLRVIGNIFSDTAWNIIWASEVDRTRSPVQVGRCMTGGDKRSQRSHKGAVLIYIDSSAEGDDDQ